jgi:imidazolonepropionase-like amidohydrolase
MYQHPMKAGTRLVSFVTITRSRAAESLNLGSEIGTIAPGMTADRLAMRGDYLADATGLRRMAFVMKGAESSNTNPDPRRKQRF